MIVGYLIVFTVQNDNEFTSLGHFDGCPPAIFDKEFEIIDVVDLVSVRGHAEVEVYSRELFLEKLVGLVGHTVGPGGDNPDWFAVGSDG